MLLLHFAKTMDSKFCKLQAVNVRVTIPSCYSILIQQFSHDTNNILNDADADLYSLFFLNHFNALYPNMDDEVKYYDWITLGAEAVEFGHRSHFNLIHVNIRSILPKFDDYIGDIRDAELKFDVLCFTETWLHDNLSDLLELDGYSSHHCTRDGRGGGVSAFVSKGYDCVVLNEFTLMRNYIDTLCLKIEWSNKLIMLLVVYRPPNGNSDLFFDCISSILDGLGTRANSEIFVTGDFNFDTARIDISEESRHFVDLMNAFSLLPIITKPTRITEHSSSLLDNIFVKNPVVYKAGIIMTDYSDHFPVFIFSDLFSSSSQVEENKFVKYRRVNDRSLNSLYTDFERHDFSDIYNCNDVNVAVEKLDYAIMRYFDLHCPIVTKTISYKDFQKPWISNELKSDIRRRQNMFVLMRLGRVTSQSYKRFRNYVTGKIRQAKSEYFTNKFAMLRNNLRATWSVINSIVKGSKTNNSSHIKELNINGLTLKEPPLICDALNEYFAKIGKNINDSVPQVNVNFERYITGSYCGSMFFQAGERIFRE